jgi:DnaJ family protein C protein 28
MSDPYNEISDQNLVERLKRERAEQQLRSVVERKIEEAQKKGLFDDLPGKGKPLDLQKNPHAGDRALAFELLQNNDYTLPWIAARNDLLAAAARVRRRLAEQWHLHKEQLQDTHHPLERQALQDEWRHYLGSLREEIGALNKEIGHVNLSIPVERLEILKVNLDKELQRIGAGHA